MRIRSFNLLLHICMCTQSAAWSQKKHSDQIDNTIDYIHTITISSNNIFKHRMLSVQLFQFNMCFKCILLFHESWAIQKNKIISNGRPEKNFNVSFSTTTVFGWFCLTNVLHFVNVFRALKQIWSSVSSNDFLFHEAFDNIQTITPKLYDKLYSYCEWTFGNFPWNLC